MDDNDLIMMLNMCYMQIHAKLFHDSLAELDCEFGVDPTIVDIWCEAVIASIQ